MKHRPFPFRTAVQLLMLLLIIGGASLRNLAVSTPPWMLELQGFCPFGALQTLAGSLQDPGLLFQPHRSHLWVLSGVLLITLLFGTVFCGYLCPLGSVQEWLGVLGKKLFPRNFNRAVPPVFDTFSFIPRTAVLLVILFSVYGGITVSLDLLNPSFALAHFWTAAVPTAAVVLLLTVSVLSLVVYRPWCRWLCPYGLVIGLLGKASLVKIRRNTEICTGCRRCDRFCPVHLPVSQMHNTSGTRCIQCSRCASSCPVAGALSSVIPAGSAAAALLVVVIFFTPLAAAWAAGGYTPHPAQNSEEGEPLSVDLSPMMRLDDLVRQLDMEYHELTSLLGLPEAYPGETLLFDIELDSGLEEITFGFIREQVEQLRN